MVSIFFIYDSVGLCINIGKIYLNIFVYPSLVYKIFLKVANLGEGVTLEARLLSRQVLMLIYAYVIC